MARSGAVRSTGSPLRATLLRALAVGALALSAWLLGSAVAAADTAEEPGVPGRAVEEAFHLVGELPAVLDASWPVVAPFAPEPQSAAGITASTTAALGVFGDVADIDPPAPLPAPPPAPLPVPPPAPTTAAPLPVRGTTADGTSGTAGEIAGPVSASIVLLPGGVSSSVASSGSASNSVPEPPLADRAAESGAHPAAEQVPQAAPAADPQPEARPATTADDTAPWFAVPDPAPLPVETVQTAESGDVGWTNPAPAQQSPGPAPLSVPTASSAAAGSHHDNSGGARGGIAAVAPQSILDPPALWAVERRTDARSPGSTPGLPSTSPD
ncbi:hypothetical protein [Umezawaea beigongshangensis]|uniref:hypothetical protein n=1 Tax=Umezawaea beigongshangensis TaxID=2780383 RepID=UPI0018F164E4|nr:hypothetical protein [Umezawaea beigongshangensis]